MIRALIDTNIILDVLLRRVPFYAGSSEIFKKIDDKKINAYITATIATDIFYLLSKEKLNATDVLKKLLKVVDVLGVDKEIIIYALYSGWKDFEDAVQAQVAIENKIDCIVTRNTKDYTNLQKIKVLNPKDFINFIEQ